MPRRPEKSNVRRLAGFATDTSEYSPARFYTSASDASGHFKAVRFDAPPSLVGVVAEILTAGAFPVYRSSADFWRDAGHHRARYLTDSRIDPKLARSLRSHLEWREAEAAVSEDEQELHRFEKLREDIVAVMRGLKKAGLPAEFVEGKMQKYLERVDRLPEPYRSRLLEMVDEMR